MPVNRLKNRVRNAQEANETEPDTKYAHRHSLRYLHTLFLIDTVYTVERLGIDAVQKRG